MTPQAPIHPLMPRCCLTHEDWPTLAHHLCSQFADLPPGLILDELRQAKRGSEFFDLSAADAIDCAELIVRYRILTATGPSTGSPDADTAATLARISVPRQERHIVAPTLAATVARGVGA